MTSHHDWLEVAVTYIPHHTALDVTETPLKRRFVFGK